MRVKELADELIDAKFDGESDSKNMSDSCEHGLLIGKCRPCYTALAKAWSDWIDKCWGPADELRLFSRLPAFDQESLLQALREAVESARYFQNQLDPESLSPLDCAHIDGLDLIEKVFINPKCYRDS